MVQTWGSWLLTLSGCRLHVRGESTKSPGQLVKKGSWIEAQKSKGQVRTPKDSREPTGASHCLWLEGSRGPAGAGALYQAAKSTHTWTPGWTSWRRVQRGPVAGPAAATQQGNKPADKRPRELQNHHAAPFEPKSKRVAVPCLPSLNRNVGKEGILGKEISKIRNRWSSSWF